MEVTTEPVYVRDMDINIHGNIILQLSTAVNKQYPGEALGAQKLHQVWKIYVRTPRTRAGLIVSGLHLDGVIIDVFDDNPIINTNKQSERIVIKDLPATLPADRILAFMIGLPQIRVKSKVLYARERIGGEAMSPFINGDRLVYIAPNPTPPLPKETVIGGHPCRIWHRSQKNFCKRCDKHGHRTADVGLCEAYNHDESVAPFRADANPLSNFFKCTIDFNGRAFKSSEHIYQFTKCMFLKHDDLANLIYTTETPREVKVLSDKLNKHERMAEWTNIKVDFMRKILRAKWNCSGRFRQTLMATSNMTIAEATSDTFWGVGVAPNLALHTKPGHFLGSNQLGKLLMDLRNDVHDQDPSSIDDVSFSLPVVHNNPLVDDQQRPLETTNDDMDTTPGPVVSPTTETVFNNITEKTASSDAHLSDEPPVRAIPPPVAYSDSDATVEETSNTPATPPTTTSCDEKTENIDTDCDVLSPALFSVTNPPTLTRVPRKPRVLKQEPRRNISQANLDSFVVRDSSLKRKPSGDVIVSPSSSHVDMATKADGEDDVS